MHVEGVVLSTHVHLDQPLNQHALPEQACAGVVWSPQMHLFKGYLRSSLHFALLIS